MAGPYYLECPLAASPRIHRPGLNHLAHRATSGGKTCASFSLQLLFETRTFSELRAQSSYEVSGITVRFCLFLPKLEPHDKIQ
jgi:hypothetical protein